MKLKDYELCLSPVEKTILQKLKVFKNTDTFVKSYALEFLKRNDLLDLIPKEQLIVNDFSSIHDLDLDWEYYLQEMAKPKSLVDKFLVWSGLTVRVYSWGLSILNKETIRLGKKAHDTLIKVVTYHFLSLQ